MIAADGEHTGGETDDAGGLWGAVAPVDRGLEVGGGRARVGIGERAHRANGRRFAEYGDGEDRCLGDVDRGLDCRGGQEGVGDVGLAVEDRDGAAGVGDPGRDLEAARLGVGVAGVDAEGHAIGRAAGREVGGGEGLRGGPVTPVDHDRAGTGCEVRDVAARVAVGERPEQCGGGGRNPLDGLDRRAGRAERCIDHRDVERQDGRLGGWVVHVGDRDGRRAGERALFGVGMGADHLEDVAAGGWIAAREHERGDSVWRGVAPVDHDVPVVGRRVGVRINEPGQRDIAGALALDAMNRNGRRARQRRVAHVDRIGGRHPLAADVGGQDGNGVETVLIVGVRAVDEERGTDAAGLADRSQRVRGAVAPVDRHREVGDRRGRVGVRERGHGAGERLALRARRDDGLNGGGRQGGVTDRGGAGRERGGWNRARIGWVGVGDRDRDREDPLFVVRERAPRFHQEVDASGRGRDHDCRMSAGAVAPVDGGRVIAHRVCAGGVGEACERRARGDRRALGADHRVADG